MSYATGGLPGMRGVGKAGKVVISTDDTVVTPEVSTVENARLPTAWLGLSGSYSATVGTIVGCWLGSCVGRFRRCRGRERYGALARQLVGCFPQWKVLRAVG